MRGFGWAVENNLLTDYKVVVLAVDERMVKRNTPKNLDSISDLKLEDSTKIIGCYKALVKIGFFDENDPSPLSREPMKRALGFCQNIKTSKLVENNFANVVEEYIQNEAGLGNRAEQKLQICPHSVTIVQCVQCSVHVGGTDYGRLI